MKATIVQSLCWLVLLVSWCSFSGLAQTPTATQKELYAGSENSGGAPNEASSANPKPSARDGLYDKVSQQERVALPWPHLREADVFWQKRIWRVIDTKQKMNQTFTYADQPFIQVLLNIIQQQPTARIYMDDEFKQPLTYQEVTQNLGSTDTIRVIDPETYEETTKVVQNDFDWSTVSKFRIKEDWIFDQSNSRMIVRILGIAPIRSVMDQNGEYRGDQAMFWAYYPDFRQHLAKYETFNPFNDSNRLTWDDVMEMRMFSSFIIKELNIQDRRIQDYVQGKDALLESERLKKQLFEFEQNLWSY